MDDRKHFSPYAYLAGLLALVFAAIWFVLNRQADLPFQIAIALAIAGVAAGVLLDPDRVRRFFSGRQARYGSNALLLVLAVAGILGVLNYLIHQNPESWDLTENQQFSLAPETIDLIQGLEEPVLVKGFYSPEASRSRENIEPLLEQYRDQSDNMVSYEFIDPLAQPFQAEEYGVSRDSTLVVVQGERSEVVSFANEREISSSIIRVSLPGEKIIGYLTGHGERDLAESGDTGFNQAERALASKNYRLEQISLLAEAEVPEHIDVVMIAGPRQPLAQSEVDAIADFLDGGKSLMVLLEPSLETEIPPDEDPLADYLQVSWGIVLANDVVVDLNSSLPFAGIAASYGAHPITDRMGNLASYFPSARSLATESSNGEGPVAVELVRTGENSWGETDLESVQSANQIAFDQGIDNAGPLTLAASSTDSATGGRVVVFGDSDFAANGDHFGLGNSDLFVNGIDWLTGQEQLIQLTPKRQIQRIVAPPSVQTIGAIFLLVVIGLPGAVVGYGFSVWWRRRRIANSL